MTNETSGHTTGETMDRYPVERITSENGFDCYVTHDPDEKLLAKQLLASTYLELGFIDPSEVNDEGIITHESDPYQEHSIYYVVREKGDSESPVYGTVRQINFTEGKGWDSFPVLGTDLWPVQRKSIMDMDPRMCVEVSALVKQAESEQSVPILLYKRMWQRAIEQGHDLWVMSTSPKLFDMLKMFFGSAVERIGNDTDYPGEYVIPCALGPRRAISIMSMELIGSDSETADFRRSIMEHFLSGLKPGTLRPDELNLLSRAGIDIEKI